MKNYFPGVEFPELPDDKPKPSTKPRKRSSRPEPIDRVRAEVENFNTIVMGIFNAVKSGESDLCRATSLSSPLLEVLARLTASPSGENLCQLIAVTRTDLNNRVAQEIEKLLEAENAFEREGVAHQFPLLREMFLGV